jgi:AbiV family abortive infection protein
MKEGLSHYKFVKIAVESLRNSLRLHFDAILLFENKSYPSAFQLSVLSLEEFAKAKWVHHYIWSSLTNTGYPNAEFEQKWLKLLYKHPEKQWAFMARQVMHYSPKFTEFIKKRGLEEKKQNATYVGLSRSKGKIDTSSRVSLPTRIKEKDAQQLISLINSEYLEIIRIMDIQERYFDVEGMDDVISSEVRSKLAAWPYKSGLKSRRWSNS